MDSRHGDPETWGNPRGVAVNNFLFCDFHFSLCLTFLKLSFLRNTTFRRIDWGYISRKCRAITKENKYNRKKHAHLRWEMAYIQCLIFSVSQMKCQCIVLRTFGNKQIIKSHLSFVCFQTSVWAVGLVFDVSNSRIHVCTEEKFQSTSHWRYLEGIHTMSQRLKCINLAI